MASKFFNDLKGARQGLWLFIPLLIVYSFSYFQRTAVPGTVFTQLLKEGFNAENIALIGSSFLFIYSLFQLVVGILADKFGGTRVVIVGGFLFVFGSILLPYCTSLSMMCLARFITGVGASSLYLSLVRETDRIFGRKNYSVFLGVVYFVGYSGGIFGSLPFAYLCSIWDWRYLLIIIGIASIVAYIVFLISSRKTPIPPINRQVSFSFKTWYDIFKNPYTLMVAFCSSANFGVYYIILSVFGKKFLEDCGNFSSNMAATVIMFLTFTCMCTIFSVGVAVRLMKNRRKVFMYFACGTNLLTTISMLCCLVFNLTPKIFVVGYILYAFASGFAIVYNMALQELNAKDIMTFVTGINNMCNYLFVSIGAIVVGKILDCFTPIIKDGIAHYPVQAYTTVFIIMLVLSSISMTLTFFIPETKGHYLHLKAADRK